MMTIDKAKKAGAEAFIAGLGCAPAVNQQFIVEACASAREAGGGLAELLGAYGTGWSVAHLAEDARLSGMPSSVEFNRLMAA